MLREYSRALYIERVCLYRVLGICTGVAFGVAVALEYPYCSHAYKNMLKISEEICDDQKGEIINIINETKYF